MFHFFMDKYITLYLKFNDELLRSMETRGVT